MRLEKKKLFDAYEGDEPYIFVSYKHDDRDKVYPIIKQFHDAGFHIWYDAHLEYGEYYADKIDEKIEGCSLFVVFLTENVIKNAENPDEFMKIELQTAKEEGRRFFPIFLDDVKLKRMYRSYLGGKQSIYRHEYGDDEKSFIEDCMTIFKDSFDLKPDNDIVVEDSTGIDDDGNNSKLIERPFPAYSGTEPYIYASYAHDDAGKVFPELKRFHDWGLNIWYDEGSTSGVRWRKEVENAIVDSSLFLVFLSVNAVESQNVRNDIFLAISEDIPTLPIYLEETELRYGLRLELHAVQAILKYDLPEDSYLEMCRKDFEMNGFVMSDGSDDHYMYVCCTHRDADLVFPEIERFKNMGYNVLHHEGIANGVGWNNEIENAIVGASLFVVFLSDNAVDSRNVRNEIFLAIGEGIPILPIYLEKTELEYGLKLQLEDIQAILKYVLPEDEYLRLCRRVFEIMD